MNGNFSRLFRQHILHVCFLVAAMAPLACTDGELTLGGFSSTSSKVFAWGWSPTTTTPPEMYSAQTQSWNTLPKAGGIDIWYAAGLVMLGNGSVLYAGG